MADVQHDALTRAAGEDQHHGTTAMPRE